MTKEVADLHGELSLLEFECKQPTQPVYFEGDVETSQNNFNDLLAKLKDLEFFLGRIRRESSFAKLFKERKMSDAG